MCNTLLITEVLILGCVCTDCSVYSGGNYFVNLCVNPATFPKM